MEYKNPVHFISAKECPFTWFGQNLVELRKVKLRKIANAIKCDTGPQDSKNVIVGKIIRSARAQELPEELSDV